MRGGCSRRLATALAPRSRASSRCAACARASSGSKKRSASRISATGPGLRGESGRSLGGKLAYLRRRAARAPRGPRRMDPALGGIHPPGRPAARARGGAGRPRRGPRYDVEFRILRKDGDVRVLHVQGDVIRDAAGGPSACSGPSRTSRRCASEHRLQAAQRIARVGWWERDYRTNKVSLSDETCRIFGVQPLDLPQRHGRWPSLIHPEDRVVAARGEAAPRRPALRRGGRSPPRRHGARGAQPVATLRAMIPGVPAQFGVMQDITELWQAQ